MVSSDMFLSNMVSSDMFLSIVVSSDMFLSIVVSSDMFLSNMVSSDMFLSNMVSQRILDITLPHHFMLQNDRKCMGRCYQENSHICLEETLVGERCRM
ncbi:hypothetical protein AVEN_114678-1 [Araneus ventricosus]|uniref:Uncharacterized protein n=1 Tax=Araneus ventricosus TaxID=182803 RepID=A0A4Y2IJ01_ARAVE|nr:hypothetical protein AVEN_114678-1 [Araneus ventricosus]